MEMKWVQIGFAAVILVSLLAILFTYNSIVGLKQEVDATWANVEAAYQRRFDLIPNLVETTKGYMRHEQKIYADITSTRAKLAGARSMDEKIAATQELDSLVSRLLFLAEDNPELKASSVFIDLSRQLEGTENRIQVARVRYNDAVLNYNRAIKTFPGFLFADMFGFKDAPYFKAVEGAAEPIKVNFTT